MARQGMLECDNGKLAVAKWILIAFNVTFWCMGAVSVGLGLWLYVGNNEYAILSEGEELDGAAGLTAVGAFSMVVGLLGIVAAIRESPVMIIAFFLLVLLAMGAYLAVGVWSAVFMEEHLDNTRGELNVTARNYLLNEPLRNAWDHIQENFECCGINNGSALDFWNDATTCLPRSCYTNGDSDVCTPIPSNTTDLHTNGCLGPVRDYKERQYLVMIPIGFIFAAFQVFGLVACVVLFCILSSTKDDYTP